MFSRGGRWLGGLLVAAGLSGAGRAGAELAYLPSGTIAFGGKLSREEVKAVFGPTFTITGTEAPKPAKLADDADLRSGSFHSLRQILNELARKHLLRGFIGFPGDNEKRSIFVWDINKIDEIKAALADRKYDIVEDEGGKLIVSNGDIAALKGSNPLTFKVENYSTTNANLARISEELTAKRKQTVTLSSFDPEIQEKPLTVNAYSGSLRDFLSLVARREGTDVQWSVSLLDQGETDPTGAPIYTVNAVFEGKPAEDDLR